MQNATQAKAAQGACKNTRLRLHPRDQERSTSPTISPDPHWLLFLWASRPYDDDPNLPALRPVLRRLGAGRVIE
jgi:hypothetical protein